MQPQQPSSAVSAEAATAAMISPAAVSVGPETSVDPISSASVSSVIPGIYRSLEVQDDSKTPYSDATQVSRESDRAREGRKEEGGSQGGREGSSRESLVAVCAFAIAPVRHRRSRSRAAQSVESCCTICGMHAGRVSKFLQYSRGMSGLGCKSKRSALHGTAWLTLEHSEAT